MRRTLRALLDGKKVSQLPWSPPIAIKYAYWLGIYTSIKLKKWQIKGYPHTLEDINMYIMFEGVIADHKKTLKDRDEGARKIQGRRGQIRKVKREGNKIIDYFEDKVNLGVTANNPMIKHIKKLMQK